MDNIEGGGLFGARLIVVWARRGVFEEGKVDSQLFFSSSAEIFTWMLCIVHDISL